MVLRCCSLMIFNIRVLWCCIYRCSWQLQICSQLISCLLDLFIVQNDYRCGIIVQNNYRCGVNRFIHLLFIGQFAKMVFKETSLCTQNVCCIAGGFLVSYQAKKFIKDFCYFHQIFHSGSPPFNCNDSLCGVILQAIAAEVD